METNDSLSKGEKMSVQTSVLETVRGNFAFEVNKFPLQFPDNGHTPWYGLMRSDNAAPVGQPVSAKYVPHTTDDVLALVESTEAAFEGCQAHCYFNEGHYVTIEPSDAHRVRIHGTEDDIWPRITIAAGFDGKAFKAVAGYFRDACSNLSMMQSVRECVVKINHNGRLRERMDELKAKFSGLTAGWENLQEVIARMDQTDVLLAEFLNEIYPVPTEPGRKLTVHENRTEEIINRVVDERARSGRAPFVLGQPKTVTVFEAYNAVQGYVQHRATKKGLPKTDYNSGFDYGRVVATMSDTTVKKAEKLALQLAS